MYSFYRALVLVPCLFAVTVINLDVFLKSRHTRRIVRRRILCAVAAWVGGIVLSRATSRRWLRRFVKLVKPKKEIAGVRALIVPFIWDTFSTVCGDPSISLMGTTASRLLSNASHRDQGIYFLVHFWVLYLHVQILISTEERLRSVLLP